MQRFKNDSNDPICLCKLNRKWANLKIRGLGKKKMPEKPFGKKNDGSKISDSGMMY